MSNKVNDELNESYVQEGVNGGLLDSRANLFCVWKMQRDGEGTVDEYLAENTLNLPKYSHLGDTLNTVVRRNDSLKETIKLLAEENIQRDETIEQLNEQNRLLKKEVNLSEEKVNNAYKRIAEYANKAYMKRLGDSETLTGKLIDVA